MTPARSAASGTGPSTASAAEPGTAPAAVLAAAPQSVAVLRAEAAPVVEPLGGEARHSLTAVLGYDLIADSVVMPGRETRESWERRGAEVVCLGCYSGLELMPAGTPTPLIYREGPHRRRHFAHPPGQSPYGDGLRGESLWHIEAKDLLRQWALTQPGVIAAHCEWTTPNRERRADILVELDNGRRLALEAQRRPLPLDEWHARRSSYRDQDITDIWLWSTEVHQPHAATDPQTSLIIDPPNRRLGLIVGRRPRPAFRWYDQDLRDFVPHWPPTPNDTLLVAWAPMDHWRLLHGSLRPPDSLRDLRDPDLTHITREADDARRERRQHWRRRHTHAENRATARKANTYPRRRSRLAPPLPQALNKPNPPVSGSSDRPIQRPLCRVCRTPLADVLVGTGVHILCQTAA